LKSSKAQQKTVRGMAEEKDQQQTKQNQKASEGQVKVDTAGLKSSYCNVCNAVSTREEVVLSFGVNQNWEMGQKELDIQLLHRIILSPFAAKRLQEVLTRLVKEYEGRHGELK
jgi:uncharacterized protein DUF3467